MAIRHRTEQIPIEHVQNGMTLLVENDEGKQVLFQVNSTGFSFQGDGPTIFIIKSEPLKNGEPWVIKHPAGTLMTRGLAQTYDDGT